MDTFADNCFDVRFKDLSRGIHCLVSFFFFTHSCRYRVEIVKTMYEHDGVDGGDESLVDVSIGGSQGQK